MPAGSLRSPDSALRCVGGLFHGESKMSSAAQELRDALKADRDAANQRIRDAAPELLEACIRLMKTPLSENDRLDHRAFARHVIAKATGGAQ